jgi:hypothetical protein
VLLLGDGSRPVRRVVGSTPSDLRATSAPAKVDVVTTYVPAEYDAADPDLTFYGHGGGLPGFITLVWHEPEPAGGTRKHRRRAPPVCDARPRRGERRNICGFASSIGDHYSKGNPSGFETA